MEPKKQLADGPTLETYLETRFNLLNARIDEINAAIRERIDSIVTAKGALEKSIDNRFAHAEQLHNLVQSAANMAIDKAEKQQHAINVASNEWRSTLNDFKTTLPSMSEFRQLRDDFAAYRLEQSRLISVNLKEGSRETKDDSRATWAIVIAIVTAVITLASVFLKH